MIGSPIVQAIAAPISGTGFAKDKNNQQNVLFLEVPNSGFGSETPSFSLLATGVLPSAGDWGFALNLSLPNSDNDFTHSPVNAVVASTVYGVTSGLPATYLFEADVTVSNGLPSGTWTLAVNSVQVQTGNLSNFPTVPYLTHPVSGTDPTTKIRRTLVASLDVTQVPAGYPSSPTLFIDTFQRADENPLNTNNWTTGTLFGFTGLQIVSDQCVPLSATANGFAVCTAVLPDDQWMEFEISSLSNGGTTSGLVRTNLSGSTGYRLSIVPPAGGLAISEVILFSRADSTTVFVLNNHSVSIGDVFKLVAQGTTISVYQNGVLIGSGSNSSTSSGSAALQLSQISPGVAGVTNFKCGGLSSLGDATCTLQVAEAGYSNSPVVTMN